MKTILMLVHLTILLSVSNIILAQSKPTVIKAYLKVSFKDKAITDKAISKNNFENKIVDALSSEGIQILSKDDIGKPGEPNLNIYVTLKDSLEITVTSFYEGGNNSVISFRHPEKVYAYKTSSDVTASVVKYVKDYIKADSKKNRKKK